MANGNGDSSSGNGLSSATVIGSPFTAKEAMGNLLWRYAKQLGPEMWNLVKAPGQVYSGELQPTMTPGPNQLSVPEYALGLAGMGLGIGAGGAAAGAELAPEGAITHFPVWHGTGAQPFPRFSDEFIGTGEGTAYEGWGHYSAQRPNIGGSYQDMLVGNEPVPVNEQGLPLSNMQVLKKYYTPGSIVRGPYGSIGYNRVIKFNEGWPADQGWSVDTQRVNPDVPAISAKYGPNASSSLPPQVINDPDMWTDATNHAPQNHSFEPEESDIIKKAQTEGWPLGRQGGLLGVNVIPEENEFLDLNRAWRDQDPGVQEKLTKAGMAPIHTDPASRVIRDDTYIPPYFGSEEGYMTGRDLYNSLKQEKIDQQNQSLESWQSPRIYGLDPDEAAKQVSQEMDAAGVPGLKFLDRPSRQRGAFLEHNNNFEGLGNPVAQRLISAELPAKTGNVGDAVGIRSALLRTEARHQVGTGNQEGANIFNDAADWLEQEHRAGNFSLNDNNRTRNFVTFNPDNLEIKTWNGVPVESIDFNPFEKPYDPLAKWKPEPEPVASLQAQINQPF